MAGAAFHWGRRSARLGDPVSVRLGLGVHEAADVLTAQGDGPSALAAYREALAIDQDHAAREPANPEWQHTPFASHMAVGETLLAQNDPAAALEAFREAVALQGKLSAADPTNADWQRDLAETEEGGHDAVTPQ